MFRSVISRLIGAITKFSVIVKIHKYKRFHERYHFISMVMEVHDVFGCDLDHFIRECAHLFHNKQLRVHLSLSFCIQFCKQRVNIAFQHALTFVIEKKIMLARDVCSRPPIIIRFHNLHVDNIRKVVCDIASYHEMKKGLALSPLWFLQVACLLAFLSSSLLSSVWWFQPSVFIGFWGIPLNKRTLGRYAKRAPPILYVPMFPWKIFFFMKGERSEEIKGELLT
jgi:hypothetical protein